VGVGNDSATLFDYFSGYLADIHFIDGQALTPSSFTKVDATTGQLVPKAYTGSFGTNGFWLKFSDNSAATATTLGKDYSGNSNNWTPNNLSVTAGAGNDSLVDTPTSYGTDDGLGGSVRGNYCTWNPLASGATLANGNLDVSGSTAARGTIGVTSGKWYYEFTLSTNVGANPNLNVGVIRTNATSSTFTYDLGNSLGASSGDVIGVALDVDAGRVWIAKNGTWVGSGNPAGNTNPTISSITLNNDSLTFFNGPFNSVSYSANFGQRPFAYTAPSGFKALCDQNLPLPTIAKPSTVMDVALWTGNGSARSITGLGFNPDLVWIKGRSGATDHALYDVVRGAQARLESNTTDAEVTSDGGVTAFNSDGFSLGTLAQVNTNSATYAGWAWDAGTTTSSNGSGSITTSLRASPSSGFSVATWSGTGSGSVTVGHGLGVAPQFFIVKDRSNARNWLVYHVGMGATRGMQLNLTTAQSGTDAGYWNNTAPTSTVATIGTYGNEAANYVGYFWAPVAGYSSFGSYTGNGSTDGPFVYTGFRPRWIVFKQTNVGGQGWFILDTARSTYNVASIYLLAQSSNAEASGFVDTDFCSNGFKIRSSDGAVNANSGTYIYAAFAENPFAYARAR